MKTLLTVMVVITLGVTPILIIQAVEASRTEESLVPSGDSSEYVASLEWAFHRQCKEVEQLRTENMALAAELARLRMAATNACLSAH
ncbi:MAG TPA: hypothetical protein VMV72_14065 [Verrucomicrobiae bacterium]|nr:hypothetical protein [Verrucomicrobiae bacterium]